MMRKRIVILSLIAYVAVLFSVTVVFRESSDKCTIRLDLFKDLNNPGPDGYRDLILNIVCFIPVGLLVGLLLEKQRLAKALLVGLLVSLTIEFSQLIWHRGVFDVNDLFNNALGALIGGGIAWFMVKSPRLRVRVLACCKRHSRAKD
jgi:glycopeptide antibiotics resistance protein